MRSIPISPALPPHRAQVRALVQQHRDMPGALLPLLHAVQHELGHIPPDVVPDIAAGLNLSRAEVHGVITYYHHFRSLPAGRHVVQVCRAEACKACAQWRACSIAETPGAASRASGLGTVALTRTSGP